jgi:hypothetical protein
LNHLALPSDRVTELTLSARVVVFAADHHRGDASSADALFAGRAILIDEARAPRDSSGVAARSEREKGEREDGKGRASWEEAEHRDQDASGNFACHLGQLAVSPSSGPARSREECGPKELEFLVEGREGGRSNPGPDFFRRRNPATQKLVFFEASSWIEMKSDRGGHRSNQQKIFLGSWVPPSKEIRKICARSS